MSYLTLADFVERGLPESRSVSYDEGGTRATRHYVVESGEPETVAVRALALFPVGQAHPILANCEISTVDVAPIDHNNVSVTVTYKPDQYAGYENEYGEVWEYDFATQIIHINSVTDASKQTHYGIDTGLAIGVDGDQINGADVYRPVTRLRISKHVGPGDYDNEKNTAEERRGTINELTWKGNAAKTVLFLGVHISKQKEDDWIFEYNFQIGSPQTTGVITLADGSTVGPLTLDPFDYVWFQYEKKVQSSELTQVVKSVHVAEVYETSRFSGLRIQGDK